MLRHTRRPPTAVACLLLIALAGCGAESSDTTATEGSSAAGTPPSAKLDVGQATGSAPGISIVGAELRGAGAQPSQELASPAFSPLTGSLTPVAVPSADNRLVAYGAWKTLRDQNRARSWGDQGIRSGDALGIPSIRVRNADTGAETTLSDGAYSIAWRRDGALAFVRALHAEFEAGKAYRGDLVVKPSLDEPGTAWTNEPARYVAAAWAGQTLLAYRIGEGEQLDLLALDGPGRLRELAPGGTLVAVSPDGTRAFVEYTSSEPRVRVLDVSAGTELASLDLSRYADAVTGEPLFLSYSGDWVEDRVVARGADGLVLFSVRGDTIALEQLLALDRRTFPHGAAEPRFADTVGNRVVAYADVTSGGAAATVLLDCELTAARCARGRAVPAEQWQRIAFNPSRPRKGDR